MTLSKLETAVRELRDQVLSTRAVHPRLANAPALVHAEAAVARANDCVRRLGPPRTQPGEQTLKYASEEIARATEAVRQARDLAAMAGRSAGRGEGPGLAR
jgi:hypothetical protein